jgi:hypothetical protein
MDVRLAAELYQAGFSLREVGRMLNRTNAAVYFALRDAGIPRRPNGTAHLYPRIKIQCAICGKRFNRRAFYFEYGCGIKARPNRPRHRVCSRVCYGRLISRYRAERARKTASVQIDYR